jgi:hypothetical protein
VRALLLALVALALAPGVAGAQIQEAAQSLRSDPVYVDPSAELARAVDAAELREEIREEGATPMFVAVLPASAAASPDSALLELREAVGLSGTYAVVVGNSFRAGSDLFPVAGEASAAAQENQGDLQDALEDFIERVGERRTGGGGLSAGLLILLALAGTLLLTATAVGVRRSRRAQAEQLAEVKTNIRDDLVALGDEIRALDLDIEMPDADPAAREDYGRAVEAYQAANLAFETARSVRDLQPAAERLEEGRWAMTCARERLAGREPPERRAPCFFDPRHGPSSRDVLWAPADGGTPREVPACEADAQRVDCGEDPAARELVIDGRRVPYWEAGPAYAPYYGGYYRAYDAVIPAILLGSMLGGTWGEPASGPGAGDFGGGGDFGGFSGGDFGGGGFGGGDF